MIRLQMIATASLALSALPAAAAPVSAGAKQVIGLALTVREPAMYETADGKEECPAGLHITNRDNFLKQFPTEQAREAFYRERVHLGPRSTAGPIPELFLQNRGSQGQNVSYQPTLVEDEPLRLVQGRKAFGFNLDGTRDGRATARSCKHDKFASADGGQEAVDNQLYRIYGCSPGWRVSGYQRDRIGLQVLTQPTNRVLIEIDDIDDERNDEQVTVRIYKGIDNIPVDAAGQPIPWSSQRIDVRYPQYMMTTTGRIADGVLVTEPIDMRFALQQSTVITERYMRDARLRLALSETKAEGLLGGYEPLREWWQGYVTSFGRVVDSVGLWSPPAFYAAAVQLADGYPDPATGECTAISVAYRIEAIRAFVVQPRSDDPLRFDPEMRAAQATLSAPEEMAKR